MGIKQDAAKQVLVRAIEAVIVAAVECKIPPQDIAETLIERARELVGDDVTAEMVKRPHD